MKFSSLRLATTAFCAVFVATLAFAADPTGTWQYEMAGRGGQTMKSSIDLVLKEGVLTGTAHSTRGDTAISSASFKDDTIAFSVVREFNGNKFEIKYSGKLAGDTIKGSVVAPSRDGGTRTVEWNATRGSAAAATAAPAEPATPAAPGGKS